MKKWFHEWSRSTQIAVGSVTYDIGTDGAISPDPEGPDAIKRFEAAPFLVSVNAPDPELVKQPEPPAPDPEPVKQPRAKKPAVPDLALPLTPPTPQVASEATST